MPLTDLPLSALRDYRPEIEEPVDFDEFWRTTLAEAAAHDLAVVAEPVETGLLAVETYDITFAGCDGDPIKAWLHLPAPGVRPDGPLPGVVQYIGYGGGRGLAHENVYWALAGFAHLVMDSRGQGSGWMTGDTPDPGGSGPAHPGYLTRGLTSPHEHYYRRLTVDAVRAVEVLRGRPEVASERVSVAGISQGGGLALAVSGLVSGLFAALPDVPFLCHFRRGAEIGLDPYAEISRYLSVHREQVGRAFETLSYFDGALHARRAVAPALFSVAMMDSICPPSTVFAAYHAYAGDAEIEVYEFNDHEGGQAFQQVRQLAWLRKLLPD